ncbi:MAG: WHG domain-containing protein [Solirubrobacteraceae bacterium]|nr:WHG domain-containing protein [Solirubrobacteraceae bacterium]
MKRARLNPEQVVQAACDMADAEGLEATTLSALARALGIQPPSLYRHIDSYGALIAAIAARGLEDLRERLSSAAAGRSGPTAVHAVADAYRAYAHEHPGRYAATTAFGTIRGHDAYGTAGQAILDVLSATLREWDLDDPARIDAIRGLRAALHGFVSLERSHGFAMDQSVDGSFTALVNALIAGLDAGGGPA